MKPAPHLPFEENPIEQLAQLEGIVSALADSLAGLDKLSLKTAASHVSFGHELARAEMESLRNEINTSDCSEPD